MRAKWILAGGAVILAGAGVGVLSRYPPFVTHSAQRPAEPVRQAIAGDTVEASGQIQAEQAYSVEVSIEGTVATLEVTPGQQVFAGQHLATIRNSGLESKRDLAAVESERAESRAAALETVLSAARLEAARARAAANQARSEYERAERAFQRQELLNREGATPRLEYEKARAEFEKSEMEFKSLDDLAKQADDRLASTASDLDAARAIAKDRADALEQSNENVGAGEVYADQDGFVVSVGAQVGQDVTPQTQNFVRIAASLAQLSVVIVPPPMALKRIRPGQAASVSVLEASGITLSGTVRDVNDQQVVVEFANPSPDVKPGLTARVRIKLT